MKVLDEPGRAIQAGARVAVGDLGLPVRAGAATLIVFWKRL